MSDPWRAEPDEWLGGAVTATVAEAFTFAVEVADEWECRVVLRVGGRLPSGRLRWDVVAR